MTKIKKLTAFTLAETLIVMGIIGVVAALTIPSLTNSTNNKDIVAKVRKTHANLDDAFGRMIAQHGELEDWSTTNIVSNTLGSRLAANMKLSKECKGAATCSGTANTLTDGGAASGTPGYSAILADGTAIGVNIFDANCAKAVGTTPALAKTCGSVVIDVDSYNGKNTQGIDEFNFWITTTGIYPAGTESDNKSNFASHCKAAGGAGCTAWVIYNGNLDYRKAADDHKCNNNSNITLSWAKDKTSCD